jgi:hypothetical protein
VFIHGRNKKRVDEAIIEIFKQNQNVHIESIIGDLNNLTEVGIMTRKWLAYNPDLPLNYLILNAGVMLVS